MGRYTGKKCRLISMFVLTAGYFFVELIVGYVTNSMALVADSFHMLSDVIALIVAYLSVKMSPKKWAKNTFGWARAEVLGALVNAVFLVALCFSIFVEACKRFIEVEKIHQPELVLIVGSVGLVVNIVGLGLFHDYSKKHVPCHLHTKTSVTPDALEQIHERRTGKTYSMDAGQAADSNESGKGGGRFKRKVATSEHGNPLHTVAHDDINENDQNFKTPPTSLVEKKKKLGRGHSHTFRDASQMNMRGIFLHVLADALGSVVVVISALVIWKTDWDSKFYLDPALSLVLVVLILKSVWPLLLESALILLQTVPTHIQVDAIQRRLLDKVDGVLAVHEFHVWQLTGDRIIASAHIRCRNLSEYMKLAEKVKEFFHNEGIHSTTIQPEFLEINELPKGTSQALPGTDKNGACVLDCPKTEDQTCVLSTCCGPQSSDRCSCPDSQGHGRVLTCRLVWVVAIALLAVGIVFCMCWDLPRFCELTQNLPNFWTNWTEMYLLKDIMLKGPEPSSDEAEYVCRQRCGSTNSFNRIQESHSEMESGHLLSSNEGSANRKSSPQSYPKLSNKESRV